MFGLNFNLLDQSIAGVPRIQQCEAAAITNNFLARYMSYLDTHISDLPQCIQNKIEIIKTANYACPAFPETYYAHFGVKQATGSTNASSSNRDSNNPNLKNQNNISTSSSIVGTIFMNYGKLPCGETLRVNEPRIRKGLTRDESIVKIQLWYKAFLISKKALLEIVSSVVADPSSLSRQEKHRLRSYRKVYYLLAHSYLLHFHDISLSLKKGRELFMRKIVDDIVSDVSERQARSTLALRLYMNQSTASTSSAGSSSPVNPGFSPVGTSGKHQSSKEKSLSSRFLKAAGNALNFSMNYGTEDEGEETADYMEDGLSPKKGAGGNSTMSSLMKSFMGGSKA